MNPENIDYSKTLIRTFRNRSVDRRKSVSTTNIKRYIDNPDPIKRHLTIIV